MGDILYNVSLVEHGTYMSLGLVIVVKSFAHFINLFLISFCDLLSIVDVTTICFSSLLISDVGKFLYTVSFSAIRIILKYNFITVQIHVTNKDAYLNLSSTLHLMR